MKKAEVTAQITEQAEDGREFAEMLKGLTDGEKERVKGIMIGLKMARDAQAMQATA